MQTFLLRLWVNGQADDPQEELRGFLDEVSTGRSFFFRGPGELLALLPSAAGAALQAREAIAMKGIDSPRFQSGSGAASETSHEGRER